MSERAFVVKAEFDVSHIDSHLYEHFESTVAKNACESSHHFIQKLLAYAILHHNAVEIRQGENSLVDEPELFITQLDNHYEHWIELGDTSNERLEKAKLKSDYVWIFFDDSNDVTKILNRINKHSKLQMVEFDSEMIEGLAQVLDKHLEWTVIVDQSDISVACSEHFWQSKFKIHHPLTVPFYDIIH